MPINPHAKGAGLPPSGGHASTSSHTTHGGRKAKRRGRRGGRY